MKESYKINLIFKHIIDDYIIMGHDVPTAIEHARIDFGKLPKKQKTLRHNLKLECPTCHTKILVERK